MNQQIFDDGSTLTWDDQYTTVLATPGTDDVLLNRGSASYSPQGVNAAASTWDDVLKLGFSRAIDAKVRPVRPENTVPVLSRTQLTQQQAAQRQMMTWAALAAVALLIVGGLFARSRAA
jgi:hypothetical protein